MATTPWAAIDEGGARRWAVGTLGGRATLLDLPADDADLRTDFGRVLAAHRTTGGWAISEVDPSGGALRQLFTLDGFQDAILTATMNRSGTRAYITGSVRGVDDGMGVLARDLAAGGAEVIVPGRPGEAFRSTLEWSASGRTLASAACGDRTCSVDVIDEETQSTKRFDGFVLQAVDDRFLIGYPSLDDRRWHRLDLETGISTPLAGDLIEAAYDGYSLDDGRFVLHGLSEYGREDTDGALRFLVYDPIANTSRVVYEDRDRGRLLYELWRSPGWAPLGGTGGLTEMHNRHETFDLLDLDTGRVLPDAIPMP